MPSPAGAIRSFQPPLKAPPTGVTTVHARAALNASEGKLADLGVTIPVGTAVPVIAPRGVLLEMESASLPSKVYFTIDGTTASATNGGELTFAPQGVYIEVQEGRGAAAFDDIHLFCAGIANVQAIFYF